MEKTSSSLLKKIPMGLIYSRLVIGFTILYLGIFPIESNGLIISIMIVVGILTDVFDGIIARRLNISTIKMRRMDSSVDQVFWLCTLVSSFLICKDFFIQNKLRVIALLALEGFTYIVSYLKFKREVATHAIASKFWALSIMVLLIQIIVSCQSVIVFNICFYLGVASRLEVIIILLLIKEWCNDVPTVYHAFLLRQGKEIKRNKLFNG